MPLYSSEVGGASIRSMSCRELRVAGPKPPEPKTIYEKAWDTVKAYPAIAILLLMVLIGSALKK